MKKQTGIALAVIIIVIILIGLAMFSSTSKSGNQKEETTTPSQNAVSTDTTPPIDVQPTSAPQIAPKAETAAPTVKSFTVVGSNYAFAPKTLEVNKGDTVKITFTNSGGMHDFKIDEFNVATERLESGDSTTVQFVADKSGTFQYYCSVGSHRAMGMWGTLTVK